MLSTNILNNFRKLLSASRRQLSALNRCPLCFECRNAVCIVSSNGCRITSPTIYHNKSVNLIDRYTAIRIDNNLKIEVKSIKINHSNIGYTPFKKLFSTIPSKVLKNEKNLCTTRIYSYRHYSTSRKAENGFSWKVKYIIGAVAAAAISGAIYVILLIKELQSGDTENHIYIDQDAEVVLVEKYPQSSAEIPDEVQYLLIGGGTAAFSACRSIKSRDPTARILMLSKEPYYPYMKPPLSKEFFSMEDRKKVENLTFEQWNGQTRSLFYEPDEFFMRCSELNQSEFGGIAIARGWTAVSVDPFKKKVVLDDGKELSYDKCLLATGSSPIELPLVQNSQSEIRKKVTYFHTLSDFHKIENFVMNEEAKTIAIYGSGLLACELACSLAKRGKKSGLNVIQIVETSHVMQDILPDYLCHWLRRKITEEVFKIVTKGVLNDLSIERGQLKIHLTNGDNVRADHLLICTGANPNTQIATTSQLEIDPENGGFVVNSELAARSNLFAAGACASYYDGFFRKRRVLHHYDHAIASGRLAGENMTGAAKPLTHQAMFWTEMGPKVGFEAVGNISSKLRTVAVFESPTEEPSMLGEDISHNAEEPKKYNKGIVFYINKSDIIEGILLWNIYNRLTVAGQVIKERKKFDDVREVAKLFEIYKD